MSMPRSSAQGVGGCSLQRISQTRAEKHGRLTPEEEEDMVMEGFRGISCPLTTSQLADRVGGRNLFITNSDLGRILRRMLTKNLVRRVSSGRIAVWEKVK